MRVRPNRRVGLGGLLAATILLIAGPVRAGALQELTLDLGRDLRAVATTGNAYWMAGGSLLTWGAYRIEDPAGARRALDRGLIDPVVDAGNIYADVRLQAPLALAVWGAGEAGGHERVSAFGYDLTRALLLNSVVVGGLKPVVDRERPNGEDYSFPSGHTSTAFAVAGVVSRHGGCWTTAAAVTAGCLTALGRMEDLKHYASDTAAGATIGWILGRSAARHGPQGEGGESAWRLDPAPGGLVLSRRF